MYVIYWSGTGNTEMMANAVGDGIKEAGGSATVASVSSVSADQLKSEEVFALGCPAMGAEELEEGEMEPFVAQVEAFAQGKKIALFGSYDWGTGDWMTIWKARMEQAGATIVSEPVICNNTPDDNGIALCKELGKAMVSA